jgi:molybdenum cofactor biosynthesis enzyme MoaA
VYVREIASRTARASTCHVSTELDVTTLGREARSRAALHRVHGPRPHERLAARRGRPLGRDRSATRREWPLEPVDANYRGEVAKRYRYRDSGGEVGLIVSVTQPFCGDCTRARLSADGKLYTCLFAVRGHDLRAVLRGGASDEELDAFMASIWTARRDRYSELRSAETRKLPEVEMSYIGG